MHRHNGHLDDLKSPAQTEQAPESAATEKEYTCPMHPEIRQRGPGTCPKCGMTLAYNAMDIPLAAGLFYPLTGHLLSPLVAALAMSVSSASVVFNALRLRQASIDCARNKRLTLPS